MAQFEIDGLTELVKAMEAMGHGVGQVADAVLLAGAGAARDVWREVAESYGLRATGDMIESVGFAKKPNTARGQLYIDIYPQGNSSDKRHIRNATKAYWLHYGDPDHKGAGWIDAVDIKAGDPVTEAEVGVWEQFIQSGEIPDAYYHAPKKTPTSERELEYDRRRKKK